MSGLAAEHSRAVTFDALSAERSAPDPELDDPLGRFENEGGRVLPPAAVLAQAAQFRAVARTETFG